MKTPRVLGRGTIRWWRRGDEPPADIEGRMVGLPELCPAAKCTRCGYEFLPYTVSAVCPRCLEPFVRDPCYGGCFSCPLLPQSPSEAK
jgi:hypothetical protein